jgi:hypothetical protein
VAVTLDYLARRYRVKPAEVRFLLMALRLADEAEAPADAAEILRRASVPVDWERFGTAEEWRALLLDLRSIGWLRPSRAAPDRRR